MNRNESANHGIHNCSDSDRICEHGIFFLGGFLVPLHSPLRARVSASRLLPPCAKLAHTILLEIAHRSEMSMARVRLKFGGILNQAFCAGAANVIFRHT